MAKERKTCVCEICCQEVKVNKAGIGTLVYFYHPISKKEEQKRS